MKEILNKVGKLLKTLYGYGILISLFSGGLTFFGYLAALIIGGDVAAGICQFIYKDFMPIVIYATSVLVLIGLLAMYLCGETALSAKGKRNK